jgi:serine/threonine-protein kinase RsbW
MTENSESVKLPARLESLHPLLGFAASCAERRGIGPARVQEIELALEELLVNIFDYAYPEGPGDVTLTCRDGDAGGMQIEIADDGIPFNILTREDPDLESGIEERSVGGLGIFFVKQLIREILYRREKGQNILTLAVDPAPAAP